MLHGYQGKAIDAYVTACGRPTSRPFIDVRLDTDKAELIEALEAIGDASVDVRLGYNPSFVNRFDASDYVSRYSILAALVREKMPNARLIFGDTMEGMDLIGLMDRWPDRDSIDGFYIGYYDDSNVAAKVKLRESLALAAEQGVPVSFDSVVFKYGASVAKVRAFGEVIDASPTPIESITVHDVDFRRDRHVNHWGDCRVTTDRDVLAAWAVLTGGDV